ncbi:MAG: hypothetical protein M1829_002203 [Trizodia sp. TS-e1964]|nr:MAG: hypothetical protein M1829_002203 [Trizodia sp. TS-e1964]
MFNMFTLIQMVALSMADGYARLTNKPQCVIVHVDVGTQGLGAAVHNASCGRVPILIFAGLSPFTIEGEMRGSRTEYIHWIQDVPDQKLIVGQYCRYTAEIKTGKNVKQMVNRALQFATSDPKGPVYLVGAREVMEEELNPYELIQAHWGPIQPCALPANAVASIASLLVEASEPLLITGYSGRNHATVPALVELTELVCGLRVIDTAGCDMCFPASHRASLGLRYGVDSSIQTADVILVIDCDVPWINTQCTPKANAKIIHIDLDPLKSQMPVFYLAASTRYRASSLEALIQINKHLKETHSKALSSQVFSQRWVALESAQRLRREKSLAPGTTYNSDGSFTASYLIATLRALVPADTIFVVEAVTNTVLVADQLQCNLPGTFLNCGGGGLGWSGGAALGIKLAAEDLAAQTPNSGKPPPFICQIVGDGTYLFSVPSSVYWISRRYKLPVLTLVLNNAGWHAPRRSALLVHPSGLASTASREELAISFRPAVPDYAGIARAAAGVEEGSGESWIFSRKVVRAEGLKEALQEAVEAVKGGRTAVLDAVLAS